MIDLTNKNKLYNALLTRDNSYDGLVFVCVKTTNIYCKLSCSARKPLESNIEFVSSIQDAINMGFRACKRCKPDKATQLSNITIKILSHLEAFPNRIWRGEDLIKLGINPDVARRAFQKDFGQSFIAYARQNRLGAVINNIENGAKIIEAQLDAGYESPSGFIEAIKKQIGNSPKDIKAKPILSAGWIDTPIGAMLAVASNEGLYLLEFAERKGLPRELENLKKKYSIVFREHEMLDKTKLELNDYFNGKLRNFTIPLVKKGSDFEKSVLEELLKIPYGTTRSYKEQAKLLNRETAVRAVANANGRNQIAIIIPCHRIIGSDGSLTGYAGKLWRKEWLLRHEKTICSREL